MGILKGVLSSVLVIFTCSAILANDPAVYFQQQVNYTINITLSVPERVLRGHCSMEYVNNSPDTLREIYIHLWPNAYSSRTTELAKQLLRQGETAMEFSNESERGWIDSLAFTVNNLLTDTVGYMNHPDICILKLREPLLPGARITISTPLRVKIPKAAFSRMGYRRNFFAITQWYPKPAVYDIHGWHPMPYLDQGEFYSEFGSFDVSITLPAGMVVAATGRMVNPEETEFLQELEQKSMNHDFSANDSILSSFSAEREGVKTLKFLQDSIHDFAWFASEEFYLLTKEVSLGDSGKKISARVYFTAKNGEVWKKVPEFIERGIRFLNEMVGPYPFDHFSVVNGTVIAGGGMEYPMITVINDTKDERQLEIVVFHELCHNWFYGILASNERKHPWMDEGITSFYESMYVDRFLNGKEEGYSSLGVFKSGIAKTIGLDRFNNQGMINLLYRLSSFNHSDQPISLPADKFTVFNYGAVVYTKAALAFRFLRDYLGEEVFDESMRTYFHEWGFRHPYPENLRSVLERRSGKNLGWFFEDVLNSTTGSCYKVTGVDFSGDVQQIHISHHDGHPAPLIIHTSEQNKIITDVIYGDTIISLPSAQAARIRINSGYPGLFRGTDITFDAILGKPERRKFQWNMLPQVDDRAGHRNFYLFPVPAWNRYNGLMAGISISKMNLIPAPFEFFVVPLWDFRNSNIAGISDFYYHLWPRSGIFDEVTWNVSARRFAFAENLDASGENNKENPYFNYSRLVPGVKAKFRNKNPLSSFTQAVSYRNISVWQEENTFQRTDSGFIKSFETALLNFHHLKYEVVHNRVLNPWQAAAEWEQGHEHIKLSGTFNYRFSYRKKNRGIDVRLFAGTFLRSNSRGRNYNFQMSGWPGYRDYRFDEFYFGRNDSRGLWAQQFMIRDGGFKTPTFVGSSNQWIASINITADIPVPIPLRLFFDLGTYDGINTVFDDIDQVVMYDGGVALIPLKGILEIYFPLFHSEDIKRNHETLNYKFSDRIRFVFNIDRLSPKKLRDSAISSIQ